LISERIIYELGFSLEFARKQHNVAGLQIADLMAYPLGRWMIDRRETEPARIALSKIHTIDGKLTGLKIIT